MHLRASWGWLAIALLACNAASAGDVCSPGAAVACRCADGTPGVAVCRADASGFEDCQCGAGGSGGAFVSSATVGGAAGPVSGASSVASTSSSAISSASSSTAAVTSSSGVGGAAAASTSGAGGTSTAGSGGATSSSSGCGNVSSSSSGGGGQGGNGVPWTAAILLTLSSYAGIAVDGADDTVVAGGFTGAIDFGCGPVQAAADDLFVAKYASDGALLWAKTFPADDASAQAIAVDPAGNILVGGKFTGAVDFGSGTPMSSPVTSAFLAKLDPNGDYVWQDAWGTSGTSAVTSVAADPLGDVAVSGVFTGAIDFPPAGGNGGGGPNFFVASLDPSGTPVWAQFPGVVVGPSALAVDALGDVVIAATSQNALYLPTTTDLCGGGACISLVKLGPDGQLLFSNAYGRAGPILEVVAAATDASDDIAILGDLPSATAVDFGGGFVTAPAYSGTFLARFDGAGSFLASSGYSSTNTNPGGATTTNPGAIACAAAGACEIIGDFAGDALDFGCGPIAASSGSVTSYLARLDATDACVASEALPNGTGKVEVSRVRIASNGDTLVSGLYTGAVDLGSGTLPVPSDTGLFILRRPP